MSLHAGKTAEHGALELHFNINISRLITCVNHEKLNFNLVDITTH